MKKALVYNRYLHTAGGGERLTLDWCGALSELGYQITLVTSSCFTGSLRDLCGVFGIECDSSWSLEVIDDEEAMAAYCKEHRFDLFVNGTFCSVMPNPAPLGIYALMFPQHISPASKENLLTYNRVLCISEFSEIYARYWWGVELPLGSLPPPISNSHSSAANISFNRKERLILNVGRFNVDGHCKRQLEAIRTFREMLYSGVIHKDWKLCCIGNVNDSPANREYIDLCRREAGSSVQILTDVPFDRLQELYQRASLLWQFTGVHLRSGALPQHCEHLGLVAMDSMCYGAIPMVYQRSGVAYMIDQGKSGFAFDNTDELGLIMRVFDRAYGTAAHHSMFDAARSRAVELGFENFKSTLASYLSEPIA